jgi:hypothetical protein
MRMNNAANNYLDPMTLENMTYLKKENCKSNQLMLEESRLQGYHLVWSKNMQWIVNSDCLLPFTPMVPHITRKSFVLVRLWFKNVWFICIWLRKNNFLNFLLFFSCSSFCFPEINFLPRTKLRNMLAVWLMILCPIFPYYMHEAKSKWHLKHADAYFFCHTFCII